MNHAATARKHLITVAILMFVTVGAASAQLTSHDVKLLGNDSVMGDQFGISSAISGNVVAVGAFGDDDNGNGSGSAYLFNATTGAQLFKLLPNDGAVGDFFGATIGIDGDLVVVGARNHDYSGAINGGAAYVFNATTGLQVAKLVASDYRATDLFGMSVAIAGGIAVVGSPQDDDLGSKSGSVYLFNAETGVQIRKLLPDDGTAYAEFGYAVAIDNGLVAVGAIIDIAGGNYAGAVYLFDAATGVQLDKFVATDGSDGDQLGFQVDLAGGLVVAGAMRDDDNGTDAGAAYVFNIATGNQDFKLLAADGVAGDEMGRAVAIENDVIVIGATFATGAATASGTAYVFNGTTGALMQTLRPSDNQFNDYFGASVCIDGSVICAGAIYDSDNGDFAGSAYIFNLDGGTSPVPQVADANLTLFPNYPNPFNPSTSLKYSLENAGEVELAIYSARGVMVRTLVSGWQQAGTVHEIIWDGKDGQGRTQSSGVYFARLRSDGGTALQKMVLMK